MAVPPGQGRMVLLQSPPTARFKVTLSASPHTRMSAGKPGSYPPISDWLTAPQCKGNGLLAAALRQDLVPANVSRLSSPVVRFERSEPPTQAQQDLLELLEFGCDREQLLAERRRPRNVTEQAAALQQRRGNTTYRLPLTMTELLLDANSSNSRKRDTDRDLEGRGQLVGWKPNATSIPAASLEAAQLSGKSASSASCLQQYAELYSAPSFNITLPGPAWSNIWPERRECGTRQLSSIVVYVHNCFTEQDADMLVRVSIDISEEKEDICRRKGLQFAQALCIVGLALMCAAAAICVLPVGVAAIVEAIRNRQASKARKSSATKAKAGTTNALPPSKAVDDDNSKPGEVEPEPHQPGCFGAYLETLNALNNPSGYSRAFTVAVTTSAALLVAAIVWAPAITPSAVHDNAYVDVYIIPRSGVGSITTQLTGKWDSLTYYLKVMGLSMLIGHTTKLALLSNMSPPGPLSRGITVSRAIYYRQVVMSVLGMVLLAFIIASYCASIIVLRSALEVLPSHWYLLAVMCTNYIAAVVLYVQYTFIKRAPLTSDAAREACAGPKSPMKLPKSWESAKHTASLPPAAKDADRNPDQAVSDNSEGGAAHTPSRFFFQRIKHVFDQFTDAVWEDEHFKYSSWVLTPVWLTILLVVFWWLSGVSHTGLVFDCLQDLASCSGGVIPFTRRTSDTQLLVQDMLNSAREGYEDGQKLSARMAEVVQAYTSAVNRTLAQLGIDPAVLISQINQTTGVELTKPVDSFVDGLANSAQKTTDAMQRMQKAFEAAENSLRLAETIGRWLGYTTAVLFALISLFNILQSFKRVLLFRAFMKKSQVEQEAMVDSLAIKPSTATRMLARAMTGMRRVVDVQPAEALESSPFESTAAQQGLRQRHSTFKMQPTVSFAPGTGALCPSGFSSASNRSFNFAANTFKLPPTGSSAVSSSSTLKSFKESQHDSLCVNIAQDIQRLEVDMARFGIGASTGLFGVMASVMWIQIRIIGLVLTFAFTVICHRSFWVTTWQNGYWVPVATVIVIVVVNMVVISRVLGSRILSDGTHIRHRGSWMTFYLMFQFCYMVLGILYATWRVVLAVVVMLLFSVSALDRSLLMMFKMLDGPYISFVTSVKLEAAYLAIAERDMEAEERERREKKQRELEQELQEQQVQAQQHTGGAVASSTRPGPDAGGDTASGDSNVV